ncbi:MAG: DUF3086 domain-containing protein [Jaaginema sp. PMC 1079.18]|nr:DUF3086 domain-containing protein [Jaaginema sp. PMC 1080.18]MEC4852116.1 DUF3086 domain-containing protein [Jaaginema sp. PMC 1079.18]MEC4866529.1 DUF3086 domain-containing protein [Jaaginema sp. PMC 1078.18]
MHPDEHQTPDQELEQAFIAESGDEAVVDDSSLTVDPWDAPNPDTGAAEALEPLPELRLKEEESVTRTEDSADSSGTSEEMAASEPPSRPPEGNDLETDESDRLRQEIARLQQENQALQAEVTALKTQPSPSATAPEVQDAVERLVLEGLVELERRKTELQSSVEQLERRRSRIEEEMQTTFAGVSQNMAIRVQGFKDYLVGSLQDLAAAAEQLDLPELQPSRRESSNRTERRSPSTPESTPNPQFARASFQNNVSRVQDLLEQYRTRPDYYGPPWQLRRTFEPIHAERVRDWLLRQGGRGSLQSMGSRLQNILIASAAISILRDLYRDRVKILVLANTPERLGEWRRGLQDCLGISRSDFGPSRGVVLFESPEALVQKAERLVAAKELPLIVIDDTEERIDLALLQFPLWLAFAPDPSQGSNYLY